MVVIDSSVLIPLSRVGKLNLLRKMFKQIKIMEEVYKEVVKDPKRRVGASEIEVACRKWIKVCKVKDKRNTQKIAKIEGIEKADASLILLAKGEKEGLLSNDRVLITVSRSKGINSWWLTTFILNLVKQRLITKKYAKQTLFNLIEAGMALKVEVYAAMLKEIDRL